MRFVVTGGSGFIGTNLINALLREDECEVINIDIKKPRNPDQENYWINVDVCNKHALQSVLNDFKPEYIVHLAARTDLDGETLDCYKANIEGVENIVDCANMLSSVKRVIFASSMLVCRLGYIPSNESDYKPINAYGESKVLGEQIVRQRMGEGKSWIILRPTSIWGPWFDVPYRNFFDAVMSGLMILPKGYSTKRSYGFVLNTIGQLFKLLYADENKVNSRTFYICDYTPLSLPNWAQLIQSASNSPKIKVFPLSVLKMIARVGDVLKIIGYKSPPLSTTRLKNMLTDAVYDTHSLEEICGPLDFDNKIAVQMTVDWLRSSDH